MKHYSVMIEAEILKEYDSLKSAKRYYTMVKNQYKGTGLCVSLNDNYKEYDEIINECIC